MGGELRSAGAVQRLLSLNSTPGKPVAQPGCELACRQQLAPTTGVCACAARNQSC